MHITFLLQRNDFFIAKRLHICYRNVSKGRNSFADFRTYLPPLFFLKFAPDIHQRIKTMNNRITSLFGIRYPIIQGGMVWCSGWRLAAAVSNAGGLGLLGAGSMHPEVLREHIRKCRAATGKPFGVNVPLMYPQIEEVMQILAEEGVRIVFTSAGNPKAWTGWLQERGVTVAHVVSSSRFATKCEEAGVDAVVAEGFEAGGHNGREETTTFCLVPSVRKATTLPLIAAGGIGTGEGILAATVLGAEGVQIGTRFALTAESSAGNAFKDYCLRLDEGDTKLLLKKLSPTRLVKNPFRDAVEEAENRGASADELRELLGRGRAKKGIFEGDLEEGELEIGQVATLFRKPESVEEAMTDLVEGYKKASKAVYSW
jgi:enoyl-[acyl-carrier protein] reductase II